MKTELENERKLKQAAVIFHDALMKKARRSPGLRDVFIFRGQKATFGELAHISPADHTYWKEKGWLDPKTKYYVNVPVNPLYNAIGWTFEHIQKRKMKKEMREAQK